MASKVEICGVNTAKLPLYKEAEMMEMIEKVKAGDKETRDKFIQGNLRLVLSVIQRRKPGRFVSGGMHRFDKGAGQFRYKPRR